jgi:hypothetical protein
MFDAYGATKTEGTKKDIDFDALNRSVVEQASLQQRETVVGVIGMIVDLGTQELPDAENVFTGSEEDERAEIAKFPSTYFKDGLDPDTRKQCRLKCYPQKPQQCVAVAIDFPGITIDRSAFFPDSKPLPLRLWLGGQFYIPGAGMIIQRPTALKVNKKLGDWSMDQKNLLHRLAVAAKMIQPNECFLPNRIDELLGKAFQFEAQVYFKKGKDGREFYTEYVKFASALGRGMTVPENPVTPMLVQFNKENDEDAIKTMRNHVVNTIKRATNYQGSLIQKQIEVHRGQQGSSAQPANAAPKQAQVTIAPASEDFDDDVPF